MAYRILTNNEEVYVTELAMKLGYNDYETFSRAFKKHFHLAPDDLKAITNSVNMASKEHDQSIILTFDKSLSEEALLEQLSKTIKDHNISIKELKQSKVFKIEQNVGLNTTGSKIKNKFTMTEENRIWKSLLKQV